MKPTFKNRLAWEQAQILMQPAMLRVVDNIRKCDSFSINVPLGTGTTSLVYAIG